MICSATSDMKAQEDINGRTVLILICSFVFVVLALAVAFLAYSKSVELPAQTEEHTAVFIDRAKGSPSSSEPHVEEPPLLAPTTVIDVTTKLTPTTTTRKLLEYAPFLCTVSDDADFTVFVFPPDGLCEVIYFDVIYLYYKNMVGKPMTKNLVDFLDHSKKHTNRTQFGIGISYYNYTLMNDLHLAKSAELHKYLDYIEDHKANNYAMLDCQDRFHNALIAAFYMIEEFQEYHEGKGQRVGFNLVASIYNNATLYGGFFGAGLSDKPLSHIDKPPLKHLRYYVFLTHWPTSDYVDGDLCYIKTPQIFFTPTKTYSRVLYKGWGDHCNMLDAYDYERFVRTYHPFLDRYPRAITFTLKPYNEKPLFPDNNEPSIGNYSWNNECALHPHPDNVSFQYPPGWKAFTTLGEICRDPVYTKNLDCKPKDIEDGCITYNKAEEMIVVWDGPNSTRTKICVTRNNLTFLYGLMAYSIDYDDWNYECPRLSPYGPYSRLRLLYKLNDYLRGYFYSPEDFPGCMKVEPDFVSLEDFRKIETWPHGGV
ncbi:uncharacterized protein [Dermacentor albipictus]|uniref:uncharacterized protein isoform X2 n=1 Tax=Dermacentor albipictus TaxID=60249 RepID=UPI0038FCDD04